MTDFEKAVLAELREIKAELRRHRLNSDYYTTSEALDKIGYTTREKAGTAILRALKKEKILTDYGIDKWNKKEIDVVAPQINTTIFFNSDKNYKLIK